MLKVLIVDDSVSMRAMVSETLLSKGYLVSAAADGQEALNQAKTKHFDAVISDVNMPNMDGIALTSELRELEAYKHTPILLLTTESKAEMKQAGEKAGATGWLTKPFDPYKLLTTLESLLE